MVPLPEQQEAICDDLHLLECQQRNKTTAFLPVLLLGEPQREGGTDSITVSKFFA
jgi:hypothetical protein